MIASIVWLSVTLPLLYAGQNLTRVTGSGAPLFYGMARSAAYPYNHDPYMLGDPANQAVPPLEIHDILPIGHVDLPNEHALSGGDSPSSISLELPIEEYPSDASLSLTKTSDEGIEGSQSYPTQSTGLSPTLTYSEQTTRITGRERITPLVNRQPRTRTSRLSSSLPYRATSSTSTLGPTLTNSDQSLGRSTYEMFCAAVDSYSVTRAGGTPPRPRYDIYKIYQNIVARYMSIAEEAMFLANIMWETGGLQHTEEIACRNGDCVYGPYYGRGYIQLTWDYNYRDASYALYGDDRLLRRPELVAEVECGWRTAMYYWQRYVKPLLQETNAIEKHLFGYTVMAINGAIECRPEFRDNERLRIYNEILYRWKINFTRPGKMTGCLYDFQMFPRKLVTTGGYLSATPTEATLEYAKHTEFFTITDEKTNSSTTLSEYEGIE